MVDAAWAAGRPAVGTALGEVAVLFPKIEVAGE
jgi:hypothetical protein